MRNRIEPSIASRDWKISLRTTSVVGALVTGLTLFAATPFAKADDDDVCEKRIVKADHHLHQAIKEHGYESKQAEKRRIELRTAREYCWERAHRWWDVEGNRWRTERDWDDHDHDRDWDHHDRDHH
jgi:hypothetical protein